MTDRNDAQLESLLGEHFAAKLDGQLGRAAQRFVREVASTQPAQPVMRLVDAPQPSRPRAAQGAQRSGWSAFAWSIGLAGGAVAAGIAVVMILVPMLNTKPRDVVINDQPTRTLDERPNPPEPAGFMPENVEHALSWNTIDQGTVYLGGEVPLRSVVRQANETVRWYDPQRKAQVEMTVPRDEVMLVGYGSQ